MFADIINVLLFNGNRVVDEDDLETVSSLTAYKADGKIREQERDVSKLWKSHGIRFALFGLEHQTMEEDCMPLRMIGYDGASYRAQLLNKNVCTYPVVSLVLYFGTKHKWSKATSLKECIKIPAELNNFVSDYTINVVNVAFLSDDVINKFTSDFRIVADYFSQMRKSNDYVPSVQAIKHADEILKLLSVFSADDRILETANSVNEINGGVSMSGVLSRIIDNSIEQGIEKGIEQGIEQGIEKGRIQNIVETITRMLENGFTEEQILKVVSKEDIEEAARYRAKEASKSAGKSQEAENDTSGNENPCKL